MVEPQGRRLARVVARLRPCRLRESCRSEDEADARGRLEVLTCDARIAVRREVCYRAFALNRGSAEDHPAIASYGRLDGSDLMLIMCLPLFLKQAPKSDLQARTYFARTCFPTFTPGRGGP